MPLISRRAFSTLLPPPIPRLRYGGAQPGEADYLHGQAVKVAWLWANPVEKLLYVVAIGLWPVTALALAVWTTLRSGSRVEAQFGRSPTRQIAEQMHLALRFGIPAPWYYTFELWRDELRARADEYMLRAEIKVYLSKVARDRRKVRPTRMPFHSKYRLINHCLEHQVRAAPYHAVLRKGAFLVQRVPTDSMMSADLFVKPLVGKGGKGAECWLLRDDAYQGAKGQRLSPDALLQHLKDLSMDHDIIIQPRLLSHPALRDIGLNALCTVRVVTCENEREQVEVTDAVMRMPRTADAIVDNFHAGGIAASVDLATGRLGPATDLGAGLASRWHDLHPVSGAPIKHRLLPYWPELMELARAAHRAVSDREMVGWDIAIVEDGPVIIEANGSPDLDIIQRTALAPVGKARLGKILSWRLQQVRDRLGDWRPQDAA
ncbi:MAG: sugar-transfer associated ATP-grasp domain-containing protein [Dongiaceae bacterium]